MPVQERSYLDWHGVGGKDGKGVNLCFQAFKLSGLLHVAWPEQENGPRDPLLTCWLEFTSWRG